MKRTLLIFLTAVLLAVFFCGCDFFISEQERQGVNPKPFNGQASWELNPYNIHAN